MSRLFVIEDEAHAEWQGKYASLEDAIAELKRRASIPWDQDPNACPCTSWKTCGRNYQVIEFETSVRRWREIRRTEYLEVSAKGVTWLVQV